MTKTIDIIIPIYSGYNQTLECIAYVIDSLKKNNNKANVIVINDASPDEKLVAKLIELAKTQHFELLHNSTNLGFVATVNRGMKLSQNDIILLNSDTQVANNWLDKLAYHANQAKVATITPFSNNASICSYPIFCKENQLPANETVASLDNYFAIANHQQNITLTTGIGFCLYISREALNSVGYFDETSFGKGYGEETDFCLRAEKLGYQHLLALDTFVFHYGSVSFGEAAKALSKQNSSIISKRYPDYDAKNTAFMLADPTKPFRNKVSALRLADSKLPLILQILHAHGGGTHKHAQDLNNYFHNQANILFLCPDPTGNGDIQLFTLVHNNQLYGDNDFCMYFKRNNTENLNQLINFLTLLKIDRIHYHQVIGWEQDILNLPKTLGIDYDVTLHDFYTVCPNIHFVGKNSHYCGEPQINSARKENEEIKGNKEVKENGGNEENNNKNSCLCQMQNINQINWCEKWLWFLQLAKRVFVPSNDTKQHLQKYFPTLQIITAPHPETIFTKSITPKTAFKIAPQAITQNNNPSTNNNIKVLLIGMLGAHKGADLLAQVAKLDKKQRNSATKNITWHVLGQTYHKLKTSSNLIIHGKYEDKQLVELIHDIEPDVIWLPFLWPETHSYTLTAAMLSGYPIVSTNIGAIPERIVNYPKYWLLDFNTSAEDWLNWFAHYENTLYNPIYLNADKENLNTENFIKNNAKPNQEINWSYDYYLVKTTRIVNNKDLKMLIDNFLNYRVNCYKTQPILFSIAYLRGKLLQVLIWLKSQYWLHNIAKLVPISTQIKLKNILLGKKN